MFIFISKYLFAGTPNIINLSVGGNCKKNFKY